MFKDSAAGLKYSGILWKTLHSGLPMVLQPYLGSVDPSQVRKRSAAFLLLTLSYRSVGDLLQQASLEAPPCPMLTPATVAGTHLVFHTEVRRKCGAACSGVPMGEREHVAVERNWGMGE